MTFVVNATITVKNRASYFTGASYIYTLNRRNHHNSISFKKYIPTTEKCFISKYDATVTDAIARK